MAKSETDHDQPGDESKSGGLNVRVVLHAVRRHPFVLMLAILLAGAAAAGVWLYLPLPKATAAVVFRITGPDGGGDFAYYKQNVAAHLKTSRILNAALSHPKAKDLAIVQGQPDPFQRIQWLDRSLKVDFRSGPEFMRVSIEGDRADELQVLLGALAGEYLKALADDESKTRRDQEARIQERLAASQAELDQLNKEDKFHLGLEGMNPQLVGFMFLSWQQEYQRLLALIPKLEQDKEAAERDLAGATWTPGLPLTAAAGGVGASIPPWTMLKPLAVDTALRSHPKMLELQQPVDQAEAALAAALNGYTNPDSPAAKAAAAAPRAALKDATDKREAHRKIVRATIERELRQQRLDEYEAKLSDLRGKVADSAKALNDANATAQSLDHKIKTTPNFNEQFNKNKATRLQIEKTMAGLAGQLEQLKLVTATPLRISIIEEPFVVPGLEGNRRMKYALGASVAVFLAGFAGLVFWEYRGRRVTHADEIPAEVGTPVIGTIPPLAADGVRTSHAHLVEAIDTARTMLMHGTPEGATLRTLLVTSAVAREGKTTLSGHLAISLTRAGFRTLLVDGDLHVPSVHELFDLPATPGLSELLRSEVELAAAIQTSPVPGLSILPAGKWTLATRQMLVGERWRRLKADLEAQFDFVVIDTAPLLLVSDTLLLAREADGVVLSVLLGTSQITRITQTVNRLRAVGANVAGAIVNNVPGENYGHGYWSVSKYPADAAAESEHHAVAARESREG